MIRDAATQRQVDAADPASSTWLSANAGSGKTRVLTDRVARLLLDGVMPQNILCLTYTKAAAAEMQNRLFKRLGDWAMMDASELRAALRDLGADREIGDADLRHARTLFARALETPGGLKIQTIHSFCAAVLRRFPLEAGVSPQFREIEERDAARLQAEVLDDMIAGPHAQVVEDLLAHFTGDALYPFVAEIAGKRDAFMQDTDDAALCDMVGIAPDVTEQSILDHVFQQGTAEVLAALKKLCRTGTKTDIAAAEKLDALGDLNPPRMADVEILEDILLFKGGAAVPFGAKTGKFPTKALQQANPELMDDLETVMLAVQDNRANRLGLEALQKTRVLYAFARVFIPAFEAHKLAMGVLDFDDLIRIAKDLLTDRDVAQWVLFRLDGGIDHVLVDEAQDTSPTQWDVIKQLTYEFASGEGARVNRERTVFVVGDKKQSIYSFQGADPAAFDAMRAHFKTAHDDAGKAFAVTSLDHSFRSSQAILSVVDATFVGDRAAGMSDTLSHIAFKENMPGRVDLWPVIPPAAKDDDEGRQWYEPLDKPADTNHDVLMAQRIADQIKRMIAEETIPTEIGNTGTFQRRKITEGDFLILVQRRKDLFHHIIRACKQAGLRIGGADRLQVGAELAVRDIAAVLRFLALPEDDLSLAAALRSPLFGWSEQALYTLAHGRPEKGHLWPALRDGDYPDTLAVLDDLRRQADFLRPYDLIERLLTRHDGRRLLLARLGPEAEDGIDAFLSQALAYESGAIPGLTGFLAWIDTDDVQVKRQIDNKSDQIRVMTVHGAKGLEAPIVILPEAQDRNTDLRGEILPVDGHAAWKTSVDRAPPALAARRADEIAKLDRERLRLLYVAMTRAEKWLIVGAAGNVGEDSSAWYNIVADGVAARGGVKAQAGQLEVTRVSYLDWSAGDLVTTDPPPPLDVTAPDFPAAPPATRSKTLSPSDLPGPKVLPGEPLGDDQEDAKERGSLIHLLLEHLPLARPADRADLGLRLVGPAQTPLVDQVIALLDAPHLASVWTAEALTEVAVTAELDGLGRMHGAIDRLIVADGHVLAIDYKTNARVPEDVKDTPAGLVAQMAAYHAALAQIYPKHRIDAAILWTQTAELVVLPENMLSQSRVQDP